MQQRLLPLEAPAAKARQSDAGGGAGRRGGDTRNACGNFPQALTGRSRDLAAEPTGLSERTLRKVAQVIAEIVLTRSKKTRAEPVHEKNVPLCTGRRRDRWTLTYPPRLSAGSAWRRCPAGQVMSPTFPGCRRGPFRWVGTSRQRGARMGRVLTRRIRFVHSAHIRVPELSGISGVISVRVCPGQRVFSHLAHRAWHP